MKYRIEHIRYIPGQGKSYNETIDNTDTLLSAAELAEYYGDYCEGDDWLEQIENESNELVASSEK